MDWQDMDRWLMGEAWVGSQIATHLQALCDGIGVRWAGTKNERAAADYVQQQLERFGLSNSRVESFTLNTMRSTASSLTVIDEPPWEADIRPSLFCPTIDIEAPLVDVGFGMHHELEKVQSRLAGSIVLIETGFEPFSDPVPLTIRLRELVQRGVVAAITPAVHKGRRLQHMSGADWRDGDASQVPMPLVQTSIEDAGRIRRHAGSELRVRLAVEAVSEQTESWNAMAELPGDLPGSIILAAHHDTTPDSLGGNDNGAGVAVMMETARLIQSLKDQLSQPHCTIQFISFGAEEQGLQGSAAFVERHCQNELPTFMLALDELATGHMKGVVLQFPELRDFIQGHLDSMNESLQCHVLSQLDASGDMFPFSLRGVPSAFLWRWRFYGKHADTMFGHSSGDTFDKVRIREMKEYAGLLSRLFVRLASATNWPANELDVATIAQRVQQERGGVFRVM